MAERRVDEAYMMQQPQQGQQIDHQPILDRLKAARKLAEAAAASASVPLSALRQTHACTSQPVGDASHVSRLGTGTQHSRSASRVNAQHAYRISSASSGGGSSGDGSDGQAWSPTFQASSPVSGFVGAFLHQQGVSHPDEAVAQAQQPQQQQCWERRDQQSMLQQQLLQQQTQIAADRAVLLAQARQQHPQQPRLQHECQAHHPASAAHTLAAPPDAQQLTTMDCQRQQQQQQPQQQQQQHSPSAQPMSRMQHARSLATKQQQQRQQRQQHLLERQQEQRQPERRPRPPSSQPRGPPPPLDDNQLLIQVMRDMADVVIAQQQQQQLPHHLNPPDKDTHPRNAGCTQAHPPQRQLLPRAQSRPASADAHGGEGRGKRGVGRGGEPVPAAGGWQRAPWQPSNGVAGESGRGAGTRDGAQAPALEVQHGVGIGSSVAREERRRRGGQLHPQLGPPPPPQQRQLQMESLLWQQQLQQQQQQQHAAAAAAAAAAAGRDAGTAASGEQPVADLWCCPQTPPFLQPRPSMAHQPHPTTHLTPPHQETVGQHAAAPCGQDHLPTCAAVTPKQPTRRQPPNPAGATNPPPALSAWHDKMPEVSSLLQQSSTAPAVSTTPTAGFSPQPTPAATGHAFSVAALVSPIDTTILLIKQGCAGAAGTRTHYPAIERALLRRARLECLLLRNGIPAAPNRQSGPFLVVAPEQASTPSQGAHTLPATTPTNRTGGCHVWAGWHTTPSRHTRTAPAFNLHITNSSSWNSWSSWSSGCGSSGCNNHHRATTCARHSHPHGQVCDSSTSAGTDTMPQPADALSDSQRESSSSAREPASALSGDLDIRPTHPPTSTKPLLKQAWRHPDPKHPNSAAAAATAAARATALATIQHSIAADPTSTALAALVSPFPQDEWAGTASHRMSHTSPSSGIIPSTAQQQKPPPDNSAATFLGRTNTSVPTTHTRSAVPALTATTSRTSSHTRQQEPPAGSRTHAPEFADVVTSGRHCQPSAPLLQKSAAAAGADISSGIAAIRLWRQRRHTAASCIQAHVRGVLCRRHLREHAAVSRAVTHMTALRQAACLHAWQRLARVRVKLRRRYGRLSDKYWPAVHMHLRAGYGGGDVLREEGRYAYAAGFRRWRLVAAAWAGWMVLACGGREGQEDENGEEERTADDDR
ncbi:MAG: hypothetical protein WDW38_010421 [Sanguina aurantia]